MKESRNSNYPKLIFRETFKDEASVRKNGGIPTNVTFENGVGSFNGSTSKINYNLPLNGTYSVRIRCKPTSFAEYRALLDFRGTNVNGVGYIQLVITTGVVDASSGTKYVNGAVGNIASAGYNNEIVVTGITLVQGTGVYLSLIGSLASDIREFLGDIDLFEIYKGTLTASEVANLYNKRWNKEFVSPDLLMDFNSTGGTLKEKTGKALTATDVSIVKDGKYAAKFNGLTSKIDTGSDFIGTKAVTICGWIKPYGYGESSVGVIVENNKFILGVYSNKLYSSSDGGYVSPFSNSNSISLNKWQFVSITRKADGKVSFYIGDEKTAPALSGTADQNSGTPVAGTTNVIIGNNSGQTRTFDGLIDQVKVYEGILSLEQITQIWSESLKDVN